MYHKSRSQRQSLLKGTTDGKLFKSRPDTEVHEMNHEGSEAIEANRRALNPLDGYQTVEYPVDLNPAG